MRKSTLIIILALVISFFPRPQKSTLTAMPMTHLTKTGKASWYSKRSPGINYRTANNEVFDDTDMTCAMWNVGFNQKIRVTNLANGKSIVVRVNDRGPHKRYVRQGRIIDLTKDAFKKLGATKDGLIDVEIEFL